MESYNRLSLGHLKSNIPDLKNKRLLKIEGCSTTYMRSEKISELD